MIVAAQTDAQAHCVLVVEDEPLMREILRDVFALDPVLKSVTLLCAENGVEGLDLYRKYHPSLVLTDMMMPLMGGAEFIRQLRKLEGRDAARIVVVTGYDNQDNVQAVASLGVKDFLKKPYEMKDLISLVKTILKV